ncbi:hypothetical protein EDF42_2839 [Curtobacterium sp. PhB172]|nr:hypothetical protein EDF42_2839 [Curtobacterium sp. PhB172]
MPGQRRDPGAHGRVRAVGARTLPTAGAEPAGTAPPVCGARCTGARCGGARCGVRRLVRGCTLGAALWRCTERATSHGIASAAPCVGHGSRGSGANGPAVRRVLSRRLHGGDGHLSRTDVAVGLQRSTRGLGEQPQRPLSDLAPGEVYRADPVTRTPGGLLHHRFTLTDVAAGGLLSVALSRGLLRVGVTHRPALWSPDVPRHSRGSDATVSPTHSQVRVYRPRARASARPRPRPPRFRNLGMSARTRGLRGTSANRRRRVVEPRRQRPGASNRTDAARCTVRAGGSGVDGPTDLRVRRCGQPGSRHR